MSSRLAAALLASTLVLAACGKTEQSTVDSMKLADSAGLAPNVGDNKPANDSAFARGQAQLDSLKAAGETPASGLAKGIQPAARASANDHSADSTRPTVKPTNVP